MVQNTQFHINDSEHISADCISIDKSTVVATLYIGKNEVEFFLPKRQVVEFISALQVIIEKS